MVPRFLTPRGRLFRLFFASVSSAPFFCDNSTNCGRKRIRLDKEWVYLLVRLLRSPFLWEVHFLQIFCSFPFKHHSRAFNHFDDISGIYRYYRRSTIQLSPIVSMASLVIADSPSEMQTSAGGTPCAFRTTAFAGIIAPVFIMYVDPA